jgi:hypothetical protein
MGRACGGDIVRRWLLALPLAAIFILASAVPALACAGLIGPNGNVKVTRTTTLAGYHDGVEHYVTSFSFEGGGAAFGSLIPLPGVPTKVERGGAWTLQRLIRETEPIATAAPFPARTTLDAAAQKAEVLLTAKIDALDITVIRGGGAAVGEWARDHGFSLSPDAPEILDYYADRSPIFLAAVFDGAAATQRGQRIGDGTPVHLTIPVAQPWVPLRILALGKQPTDRVDADVYLLTDRRPALLPRVPSTGLQLLADTSANARLLNDLRSDAGMSWVPRDAWLTKIRIGSSAADLRYDLAIDPTGVATPSRVAAGLEAPRPAPKLPTVPVGVRLDLIAAAAVMIAGWLAVARILILRRRPA